MSNVSLCLGVGPYPIHADHMKVMETLGGQWHYIDKYIHQPDTYNYDVEKLPYDKNSIHAIYASHILEHIAHYRVPTVLKHWYELLEPKGAIIVNVPDLEWMCFNFLETLLAEREQRPISGYYRHSVDYDDAEHDFLQIFYGSHAHEGEIHKSGFTKEALRRLLIKTGFKEIDLSSVIDSHDMGCLVAYAIK